MDKEQQFIEDNQDILKEVFEDEKLRIEFYEKQKLYNLKYMDSMEEMVEKLEKDNTYSNLTAKINEYEQSLSIYEMLKLGEDYYKYYMESKGKVDNN